MKSACRLFITVICFLALIATFNTDADCATTIVSTFGEPGHTFDNHQGWGLGVGGAMALPFIPSETITLDSLSLAAMAYQGTAPLTVSIASGNSSPGPAIESFQFSLSESQVGLAYTGMSRLHPVLNKGTQYWMVMSVDSSSTTAVMLDMNDQGVSRPFSYLYQNIWYDYGEQSSPAFAIYGSAATPVPSSAATPVPIMGGWWLLPGMLAGIGIFARRRKE